MQQRREKKETDISGVQTRHIAEIQPKNWCGPLSTTEQRAVLMSCRTWSATG